MHHARDRIRRSALSIAASRSKKAFIDALQRLVVATHARQCCQGFHGAVIPDDGVAYFLRWIVHGAIIWCQRYEGLIRA